MSSRRSTRSQSKKQKTEGSADGVRVGLTDLPPDVLLRIQELICGEASVHGTGIDRQKHRYAANWRMAHKGMRAHALMPAVLQVALPPSLQPPTDEQNALRLHAWVTSLAAFLKTQPTSQQVDLLNMHVASSSVNAVLPLAPFVTSLRVTMDRKGDLSRRLSYLCKHFPRLRILKLHCEAIEGELQPFSSFRPSAERLPAMDTLETLEFGSTTSIAPLLLPSTIDLTRFTSLRHVTLTGGLHAEGSEAKRQRVLKLQPHVTVSHSTSASSYCTPTAPVRFDDPALKLPIQSWGAAEKDEHIYQAYVTRVAEAAGCPERDLVEGWIWDLEGERCLRYRTLEGMQLVGISKVAANVEDMWIEYQDYLAIEDGYGCHGYGCCC